MRWVGGMTQAAVAAAAMAAAATRWRARLAVPVPRRAAATLPAAARIFPACRRRRRRAPLPAPPLATSRPWLAAKTRPPPPPRNGFETLLCILLTLLRRTRAAVEELSAVHSGWVVTSLQLRPALDRLRTHHGQLRALFSIIHLAAKLSRSPSIRASLYVDVRDHPELGAPDKWRSAVRMDDFFGRYFGFHYLPDMRNVLQVVKIARGSVGAAVASSGSRGAPSLVQSAHILGWGWLYSNMTALQALGVPVHGAAAIGAEPAASSSRSLRAPRATVEEVRSFFNLAEDPFVSGVSGLVAADVAVDKAFLLPPVPDWLRHATIASTPAHLSEAGEASAAAGAFGEGDVGQRADGGDGRAGAASEPKASPAGGGGAGDAGVATAAMKGVDGMFHAFTSLLSLTKPSSAGEVPPAPAPGAPAVKAAAETRNEPMAAASAVALADTSTSATADTAGSAETPPPAAPLVTADGGTRPAPSVAEPPACGGGPGGRPRAAPPPKPRKRTRGKSRVAGVRARLLSHAPRAVGHLSRHAVPATGSASASPPSGVATAGAPAAAAPAAGAPPAAAGASAAAASGAGPDAAPAGTDRADAVPPTMSFEVLEAELAAAESDGGDGRGSTRDTSAERLPPADDGGSGASSAPTSRPRSPQLVAVAEATTGAGDRPPSSAPSGGGGGGGTGTAGVAPCKVATPADSNGGLGAFTPHSLLGKHLKGELARLSSSLESMLGRGVSPPAAGLILHIHGGGFISQSSLSHSVYTREWAAMLPDAVILSVDYSLAPEAQFPVALNETVHAYGWALANGAAIGTTASSVVVAGDSAGGNLAVALCLKVQELGMRPPDGTWVRCRGCMVCTAATVVAALFCVLRFTARHLVSCCFWLDVIDKLCPVLLLCFVVCACSIWGFLQPRGCCSLVPSLRFRPATPHRPVPGVPRAQPDQRVVAIASPLLLRRAPPAQRLGAVHPVVHPARGGPAQPARVPPPHVGHTARRPPPAHVRRRQHRPAPRRRGDARDADAADWAGRGREPPDLRVDAARLPPHEPRHPRGAPRDACSGARNGNLPAGTYPGEQRVGSGLWALARVPALPRQAVCGPAPGRCVSASPAPRGCRDGCFRSCALGRQTRPWRYGAPN